MYACIFAIEEVPADSLYAIACQFSFAIEVVDQQTIVFDISGNTLLLGTVRNIANAIAETAVKQNIIINIAIASNPDAAVCTARCNRGTMIISAGYEGESLGDLPIEALTGGVYKTNKASAERYLDQVAEIIDTLK